MKKGILICFIGIDGSGKTTVAKKINKELREEELDSLYIYGRIVPFISRFFMYLGRSLIIKKKKDDIFKDYGSYTIQKKKIFKNGFFSKMFKWIILFDHVLQLNLKVKTRLLMGKIVICDRYIFDTVITDIAANLDFSILESTNLIKKMFYWVPQPDYMFYIDVPVHIAYARKDDVPHLDYLIERKRYYDVLENSFEVFVLDGTKTVDEILEQVRTILSSSVGAADNE